MKKRNLYIIMFVVLLIIGVSTAIFWNPIKQATVGGNYQCLDEVRLCKNAIDSGDTTSWGEIIWLCDMDDVIECPRTWDSSRGMWLGGCLDGTCADDTKPIPTPDCSEGWERCCYSAEDCDGLYREDGNVYKCIGGQWQLYQTCTIGCEEFGIIADCKTEWYYCVNGNRGDCFKSSQKLSNCYDTVEECRQNIGYCCLKETSDGITYTWKLGGCEPDELYRQGTQWTKSYCESRNNDRDKDFCSSCFSWIWDKTKDESERCEADVVWKSESWLGKLFGVKVTQDMWCPVFLMILASLLLITLTIIYVIINRYGGKK